MVQLFTGGFLNKFQLALVFVGLFLASESALAGYVYYDSAPVYADYGYSYGNYYYPSYVNYARYDDFYAYNPYSYLRYDPYATYVFPANYYPYNPCRFNCGYYGSGLVSYPVYISRVYQR